MSNTVIRAAIIRVPTTITFADLRLARDPVTLDIDLDVDTVVQVCIASGIQPSVILDNEDALTALLYGWYSMHREAGGPPDPVAEQLIAEAAAEAAFGEASVISHAGTHRH